MSPMSLMFEVSKFRPLALTGRNWNGHVPLLRRTLDVWLGTEANNNATSWTHHEPHDEHMMKTWWSYDEKHGRYQDLNLCAPKLLRNLDAKWFKIFARSQHEISLEFLQSIFIILYPILYLTYLEGLSKTSVKNVLWIQIRVQLTWQSMDLGPNWWCKFFKASHSIRIILPHHDWKTKYLHLYKWPKKQGKKSIGCVPW